MARFRLPEGLALKLLAFTGAFAAVLAQAEDLTDPRYWMAALASGCTAVLALMRAPNTAPPGGLSRG